MKQVTNKTVIKQGKKYLTVAILTKDAQDTLENTLTSVQFADEIIVIDHNSQDKTVDIALKYTGNIYTSSETSFATRRNMAIKKCRTDWILYIDSDEIVSSELAAEIRATINTNVPGAYLIVRDNYFLGTAMYPDSVERLFHLDILRGWQGKVHESPVTTVTAIPLLNHLTHNTHRTITDMLTKTNEWSEIEADLRILRQHPPIVPWRMVRIALTVWWQQLVHKRVWKFGREGWFEGYFQVIDKLIVFTKVWERQQ